MSRHSPTAVLLHLVWATSRRRRALPRSLDATLLDLFERKTREQGCVLIAGGFGSDHVHFVVRLGESVSLSALVKHLKGGTMHELHRRQLLPRHIRWQVGYWAQSFGPKDLPRITRYVRRQREHHASPPKPKRFTRRQRPKHAASIN